MFDMDIVGYLKEYHTEENTAINSRDLRCLFNLTDRELRLVVSRLRQEGNAICSSSNGYWYSENPSDIQITLSRLEGQVKNMNLVIKGLKGVITGGHDNDEKQES